MVHYEGNDSRVLNLLLMLNGCQLVHRLIHKSFLKETVRFPEYEEGVTVYAVLLKKRRSQREEVLSCVYLHTIALSCRPEAFA